MEQNILISQNKRVAYLDTLRVLACLMVVLVHSPVAHTYLKEAPIYGIVSYLCSPCIGLFLMVSGALLLPTTLNLWQFLTRRFSRILWPLIIWSVIYIFVDAINCGRPIFNIFSSILHIPFGPTAKFVQSWYLYTLLGIYLFIPIFNTWIKNNDRRNSLYFILIWSVALINPFLKAFSTGGCAPLVYFCRIFWIYCSRILSSQLSNKIDIIKDIFNNVNIANCYSWNHSRYNLSCQYSWI